MSGDFRKRKELEEARKAGLEPAERDEEGNEINPHIPQYIVKAPWYIDTGAPSLKHQRTGGKGTAAASSEIDRSKEIILERAVEDRFRRGACENCGSLTHKAKDCLERPRKVGARFRPERIGADEKLLRAAQGEDFDGKRDRWAGYDPEEYTTVVEAYEAVEEARKKLKAERKASDTSGSDSSDTSDGSSDTEEEEEEEKYAEAADMPGQQLDGKGRMTVRNLRLREDTAKYLYNLDPESAYYDPKTRSMRENPLASTGLPATDLPYAGDNFIRASGDAPTVAQLQLFAWQAAERGLDVSAQAGPSQAERLMKEYQKAKGEEAQRREEMLREAYGSNDGDDDSDGDRQIDDNDDLLIL